MAGAISSLERTVLRHGGALSPFTCTAVLPATSFSGACSHGSSSCGCRCMHASASSLKGTTQQGAAPKLPAGWKWSGTGKEERKAYNTQMAGYRRAVGKLRNEWTPLIHAHNAKVRTESRALQVQHVTTPNMGNSCPRFSLTLATALGHFAGPQSGPGKHGPAVQQLAASQQQAELLLQLLP